MPHKSLGSEFSKITSWPSDISNCQLSMAQCNLGLAYVNGHGLAQNYNEGQRWFREAALRGNVNAQRNLGAMYATGRGVALVESEARKWYGRAADQGDVQAKQVLERMTVADAAHTYTLAQPPGLGAAGSRSGFPEEGHVPMAFSAFRMAPPRAERSAIDPSVFRFSSPQMERRTMSFGGPSFGGFRSMGGGVGSGMRSMGFGRGRR